ncbi:hypothetical protein VTL71DRAFT_13341, partial [Oculimacula yallundae]
MPINICPGDVFRVILSASFVDILHPTRLYLSSGAQEKGSTTRTYSNSVSPTICNARRLAASYYGTNSSSRNLKIPVQPTRP